MVTRNEINMNARKFLSFNRAAASRKANGLLDSRRGGVWGRATQNSGQARMPMIMVLRTPKRFSERCRSHSRTRISAIWATVMMAVTACRLAPRSMRNGAVGT